MDLGTTSLLVPSPLPAAALGTGADKLHTLFIQNVAHELRTPLTIVQGYLSILAEGALGDLKPEQLQALGFIKSSADRLQEQVELIETLLRAEASQLNWQAVRLADIAASTVDARRVRLPPGLAIEVAGEQDWPRVAGDIPLLIKLIDCLLDNAIKFTPAGRVQVETHAESDWVRLTVSDTGIGMSPEEVARLLLIHFYQGDGSATRCYGGYGLGLTVVSSVARVHGARIEIASHVGRGSQFTVRFPRMSEEASLPPAAEPQFRLRRILIVDDEATIAEVLQAGLERLPDCEVMAATNAEQALELFGRQSFDLLITDYMMPGTDGFTLAERVRRLFPQTAVIMVTAFGNAAVKERASRAAIQHVLDKPVTLSHVRNVVLTVLSDHPQA